MMKRSSLCSHLLLLSLALSTTANAQTLLDIGIFPSSTPNVLEIRVKPTQNYNQVVSSLTFTIRWQTATGASLGAINQQVGAMGAGWCPSTSIPLSKSPDGQIDVGGFRYQTINGFGFQQLQECSFSTGYTWLAGQEVVIAQLPIIEGTGCPSFNIVNDSYTTANNKDFYASLGGLPATGVIFSTGTTTAAVVAVKAFLDGAFVSATNLMRDDLRVAGYIPLSHPYGTAPFNHTGTETIAAGILQTTGNNAIVDWVLLEARNSATPATVVARRAALIQRDGDIVDLDGSSAVGFPCLPSGTYHIAVRHRNHAGVMTSGSFTLSASTTTIDLTLGGTGTFGTNARRTVGAVRTFWAGNANANTLINYSGSQNDRTAVLNVLGASTYLTPLLGYQGADVNMNGTVTYSGGTNDRTTILTTVGASTYLTPIVEQLP
jgi:hypothetical protein